MKRKKEYSQSGFEAWSHASFRELLRFHWKNLRGDHRDAALWMMELLLGVGVAASIALYVDPEINLVPVPWNYLVFILIVGVAYYLYGFTRPFRVAKRLNTHTRQQRLGRKK